MYAREDLMYVQHSDLMPADYTEKWFFLKFPYENTATDQKKGKQY